MVHHSLLYYIVLPLACHQSIWSLSQTSCRLGRATGSRCPDLQRQHTSDFVLMLLIFKGSGETECDRGRERRKWRIDALIYKFVVWTCVWQQEDFWIIRSVNKQVSREQRKRSGWAALVKVHFISLSSYPNKLRDSLHVTLSALIVYGNSVWTTFFDLTNTYHWIRLETGHFPNTLFHYTSLAYKTAARFLQAKLL